MIKKHRNITTIKEEKVVSANIETMFYVREKPWHVADIVHKKKDSFPTRYSPKSEVAIWER